MHSMKALPLATLTLLALAGCDREPAPAPRAHREKQFTDVTVARNRDVTLPDGFRGEVHPLLHGEPGLELTAHWKPTLKEKFRSGIHLGVVDNASLPEYSLPADVIELLTESTPARETVTYGARELSVFLPEEIEGVGQMWAIDPERAALFLQQFHPLVSTTFDRYHQPYGRRPGPAGAFGILRAVSDRYLDLLFRVHAEFDLSEGVVLYTPACFLGRMVIDRQAGRVDYLEMHVPTDRPVNVNITLTFPHPQQPDKEVTNIVFEQVDPMQLVGGDAAALERPALEHPAEQDALALEEAQERLKSPFYKFMDIAWVPTEQVIEIAQKENKPILAVVLTSPLDDQSC